jgi:DNA-binding transcriptional ArsR family regulator
MPDYDAQDVLELTEPAQLRALGDEVRTKMCFLLRDRARSTTEVARELGLAKSTAAHHLKVLERAGLVRVVRTRQVRAVTERYYGRTARLFVIKPLDAGTDVPAQVAALTLRQAADELAAAPCDEDNSTVALVHARIAPKDAKRFVKRLNRLVDELADRTEGAGYGFAVAFYPTDPPSE